MKLKDLCKESPEFREVITAVLRGEASYCLKTGKLNWIIQRKSAKFKKFN